MKLFYLSSGPLKVNSYFLVNEKTNTAILIDGGENYNLIKQTANDNKFTIKHLLLTHAHFDHAGNAKLLQDDGVKVYVSEKDAIKLKNNDNLAYRFGRRFNTLDADFIIKDGDVLNLEGITVKVLKTPGHTDGSLTFIVDDMLFTGDTLFYECIGRTDFVTGDRKEMINSVKKLFSLDKDYKVFPGHNGFTTLSHEREFNILKEYE